MPDDDFPSAADIESGEDVAHIIYYDDALDEIHDEAGWVDGPPDDFGAAWEHLYDRPPTWIERLWWRGRWLVNGVSFSLPLVLLLAALILAGELSGSSGHQPAPTPASSAGAILSPEPDEAVNGAWPAGVTFARHIVPAMIRDGLAGGELKGYQFEGRGGFLWTITVAPEAGSALDPQITLYGPSGELVAMNDNRTSGDPAASLALRLDEDGPYRLVVAAAGASSGSYVLSVFVE